MKQKQKPYCFVCRENAEENEYTFTDTKGKRIYIHDEPKCKAAMSMLLLEGMDKIELPEEYKPVLERLREKFRKQITQFEKMAPKKKRAGLNPQLRAAYLEAMEVVAEEFNAELRKKPRG